ncbi:DsrE family protein [Persephonella sp.]
MWHTIFLALFIFGFSYAVEKDEAKLEVSDTTYLSLKVVYDWNLKSPEEVSRALTFIRNHLKAYTDYSPLEEVEIVVVSHGAEIPVFAKQNKKIFKETVERIKSFYENYGVKFYICYNAAKAFGFDKKDFPSYVILTPAGVAKLAALQEEGYRLVPVIVNDFKSVKEKYGKKK